MALRRVDLSTDVYFVCLNHAMCTEGEEIVGLLVGEVDEERVAHVVAVLILRRSDKRKDRVEISPEQLSNASTEAEKLACILKRPVRVVGWYHSHPKLTVYPSLVDVCTQESYQLMDEGFIGMIFSVFNTDPNKFGGRIQMICYQSQTVIIDCNVEKSHVEIPIQLVPSSNISDVCMNSVIQLPRFLCQEEQLAYQMANQVPLDYLTRLHNSSVYLRKMGQIAEVICGPLLKMLEERILNNEMKRKRLQERKKALTAMIERARTEKAKREQEVLEKIRKEQGKKEQLKEKDKLKQDLEEIEEQELRAALLKDQKSRIKARQLQQEKKISHNENKKMEIEHLTEQTQFKPQNTGQEINQLGDQEVPQLKKQNKNISEGQEIQEYKQELQPKQQDCQTNLRDQEMQEIALLQKKDGDSQSQKQDTVDLQRETSVKNHEDQSTSTKEPKQMSLEEEQTVKDKVNSKELDLNTNAIINEKISQKGCQTEVNNLQINVQEIEIPLISNISSISSQTTLKNSPSDTTSDSVKMSTNLTVTDQEESKISNKIPS